MRADGYDLKYALLIITVALAYTMTETQVLIIVDQSDQIKKYIIINKQLRVITFTIIVYDFSKVCGSVSQMDDVDGCHAYVARSHLTPLCSWG